jgi:GNAT superfamily N-acetyltransferase
MFELEDVGSLESFARAVTLRNPHYWMSPLTPEQAKAYHEELGPEYKKRAVLVKEDGSDIGYIRVVEAFWTSSPEVRANALFYPTTEEGRARLGGLIALTEELTLETGGTISSMWAHSDHPEMAIALEANGYTPGQMNPVTATDLGHFDAGVYTGTIEAAKAAGYEFVTLADLRERRPDSALREYYEFDMAVMEDVPLPDPFQPVPFALFEREMFSPGFDFSLIFLALHDGTIAAGSGLFKNLADPTIGNTGITGTRREHRRKGLATALKAIAMQAAKERGVERLFTDNEERNPMLQLNLALGFKEVLRSTEYRKSLR